MGNRQPIPVFLEVIALVFVSSVLPEALNTEP
jgi:hypothetical protein